MKKIFKKIVAVLVVGLMVLSQSAFAAEFKDMPDNWATEALQSAVDNGLLGGNNGYIFPDNYMTRAEMATIMARACGAVNEADISAYTDVSADDWYYSSMAKAVAMKAFTGSDNRLNPDNYITRQEAFVVLARVFSLNIDKNIDETVIDGFKDGASVASWARKEVAAVIGGGFVSGSGGYVNPESNITRAEFAVVMDRLVEHYIDDPEITELPAEGNVMFRVGGITVDGMSGDRMVIVGDGAGEEDVTFTNADLSGRFIVRGGKNVALSGKYGEIRIVMPYIEADVSGAVATRRYVGKDSKIYLGTITAVDSAPEADDAKEETKAEETVKEETEETDEEKSVTVELTDSREETVVEETVE